MRSLIVARRCPVVLFAYTVIHYILEYPHIEVLLYYYIEKFHACLGFPKLAWGRCYSECQCPMDDEMLHPVRSGDAYIAFLNAAWDFFQRSFDSEQPIINVCSTCNRRCYNTDVCSS